MKRPADPLSPVPGHSLPPDRGRPQGAKALGHARPEERKGAAASLIRIVILDDSRLFREGLRHLLTADPSLVVVGDGDGAAVRDLLRTASPDILLADIRVEGALALCAELRHAGARPWVILLGADADDDSAVKVLEAGARGILAKSAGAEHLMKAIRFVHEGQIWAGKRVVARLVEELATRSELSQAEEALLAHRLSPREQELVQQAAGGLSTEEIADRLAISQATVKAHLTSIFQKLGVRDRVQLIARYRRSLQPTAPR